MIPLPYKIIAALLAFAAILAAVLGYGHRQYTKGVTHTTDRYEAALGKQKAEAASLLASETAKTRAKEQALQDLKNTQELQDADHKKTIATVSDRMRRIVGPTWRLRDPHAPRGGPGGGSAPGQAASATGDRADDGAQAGGLVSEPLSRLLLELTASADDINAAYSSCRSDAYAVRGITPPP